MKLAKSLMSGLAMMALAAYCSPTYAQDCATGDCGTGVGVTACPGGNCGGAGFGRALGNNGNCDPNNTQPCAELPPSKDCIGAVGPGGQRYLHPAVTARLALQDHFSPNPFYSYGPAGLDATRTDYWNRNHGAPQYAWHGGHTNWRTGQPMALVVPPTAAFQTEYNWGVGQTRSIPIYHQFTGGGNAGFGGVGAAGGGAGLFRKTPYRPNSTSQFGIYPVRGPW